jgi:hypothetical protein
VEGGSMHLPAAKTSRRDVQIQLVGTFSFARPGICNALPGRACLSFAKENGSLHIFVTYFILLVYTSNAKTMLLLAGKENDTKGMRK